MSLRPDRKTDAGGIARFVAELQARRPGFTPEWRPAAKGADAALIQIAARYLEAIAQRLEQAPAKNRLAFLDALGIRLIPAQAARAPMVFEVSEKAADARIPAGTRVAAPPPPERTDQIIFETERSTGLSAAKLQEVVSLWPGRDQYIDHSAAALAGQAFQPFNKKQLQDTPHYLYLAHDTLLALAGKSSVDLFFEMATGAGEPLEIVWEYWDGAIWREFLDMRPACGEAAAENLDGTAGLTRSGKRRLQTDCAETSKTPVNTSEAFWIRGRLTGPLLPDPARVLPEVEGIRLATEIACPLSLAWHAEPGSLQSTEAHVFIQVRDDAGVPLRGIPVTPDLIQAGIAAGFTDVDGEYDFRYGANAVSVALGEFQASAVIPLAPNSPGAQTAITFTLATKGLSLDKAFGEATAVDVSKPFFPLGQQPQPGSVFYFTNQEVFSKPGARLQIYIQTTPSPSDQVDLTKNGRTSLAHSVNWEYWNGKAWAPLGANYSNDPGRSGVVSPYDFSGTGMIVDLTVPPDLAETEINGQAGLWMRVRQVSGGYGYAGKILSGPNNDIEFTYVVPQPPALSKFLLGYTWQYGPFYPERVLTYNDFQYRDRTEEARWPGLTFQPFQPVSGITPALYLGFDKKSPVDRLGIFFDLAEARGDLGGPALLWEYWDALSWQSLGVEDETHNLRIPGIVGFVGPDDSQPLARFDLPLYWLRARLKEDGPPGEPTVNGIYPNAVWAIQHQTVVNEPLGASTGQPNQSFAFRQIPVLDGEVIEVREVAGLRAQVEWRLVANEVSGGDAGVITELETLLAREGARTEIDTGNLRLVRNRNKQVTEVWVRWQGWPHLFFSGPNDRHYVVDRARGLLLFGDGEQGKVPPPGAGLQARRYLTGGGLAGNLPARAITQLLGPLGGIESAFNPRPAEGGAEAETLEAVSTRGPQTLRHRGRAIAAGDYETLAREANANVAVARALPCRGPNGQRAPGWVTLVIIPQSQEARPWPSFGLRQEVQKFVSERAAANLMAAGHVHVTGPDYLEVEVEATIAPKDPAEAGVVETQARAALQTLLHPLRGGSRGRGWEPGRPVFLAEVAAVLERLDRVDYVAELALLSGGVVQGNRFDVPAGKTVVAGNIRLKLIEG